MKKKARNKLIVITLMFGLLPPASGLSAGLAVAAGNGKKQYKLGQTLEAEKKFDQAAEAYLAALAEGPHNVEYRIAYQRAATQASVTLVRSGRESLEQGQYEEAYNAFRRAYQFDKTNQLAKDLAERALSLQRQVEGIAPVPVTQTPYGATLPIIGPPGVGGQGSGVRGQQPRTTDPGTTPVSIRSTDQQDQEEKDKVRETIIFRNQELEDIIRNLAGQINLNVVFDSTFRTRKTSYELRGVTVAQALDTILVSNNLFFEPVNDNTIVVAVDNTANRTRLQQMSVQTFYLKNSDDQTVQTIQTSLSALFGQRVFVVPNPQLRSLTVRTTPETLKLVSGIINALDKDKPEILVDVSIYEVSRTDLLEIGNQLLFEGFSQGTAGTLNNLGATAGQIITEQRLSLSIPTSIIRLLQTRGHSRLIDSLQVHALDGQQVTANVGQRIPVQTASLPSSFASVQPTQGQQPGQTAQDRLINSFNLGVPQIEYQDVGLNIEVTPTIYSDDDIKLEMNIETSGVAAGPTSLTPIFTQRRLKSVATVQTGQAAMMAAVAQNRREESRSSLPIIGFLPVIGRFFSIPTQRQNTTDLIITVTPHVIRSADIREEDRLAMSSGLQLMGISETVESFLERREQARKRMEDGGSRIETARRSLVLSPLSSVLSPLSFVDQGPGTKDQGPGPPGPRLTKEPGTKDQGPMSLPASSLQPPSASADRGDAGPVVRVQLQPGALQPQVGERLQVTVWARSDQAIQQANLVLRFNPAVLRVTAVTDGGGLSGGSGAARISFKNEGSGSVHITLRVAEKVPATLGSSPLAHLEFDVVGPGESALAVDNGASIFIKGDGRALECVATPAAILVK
jgi:general secretion pathway protein D